MMHRKNNLLGGYVLAPIPPPPEFASLPLKKKTSVRLLVWTTSAVHTLEYKATMIEQVRTFVSFYGYNINNI